MTTATLLPGSSGAATVNAHGDVVEISVPENPTTGYRWALASLPYDLLDVDQSVFEPAESGAPGAGGHRRVVLRIRGKGRGVVELKLAREWQPEQPIDGLKVAVEA